MILFWSEKANNGYLSNWYPASFVIDNTLYKNSEQYMMAQKALVFNDQESYEKIIHASEPKTIKALGREVKNFDTAVWDQNKEKVMHDGLYAKFTQNSDLKEKLLDTYGQTLAEASPYDKIWGIGMYASNKDAKDPKKWKGQNLLGKSLMKVRDEIAQEEDEKAEELKKKQESVKTNKVSGVKVKPSMIKPDMKVIHKVFGEGTVISKNNDVMTINFANYGNKNFKMDAFEKGFLTLQ